MVQTESQLKVSTLTLFIKYNETVVEKKMPETMKISALLMALQRQFKLLGSVSYGVYHSDPSGSIELMDRSRELSYYHVVNGSVLVIKPL